MLPARDVQKLILVEKLGRFFDTTGIKYSGQIAKIFLGEKEMELTTKGLVTKLFPNDKKDLTDEVAQNPDFCTAVISDSGLRGIVIDNLKGNTDFITGIIVQVNAKDLVFQDSVKEIMSQLSFRISTSDDAMLS
ncbi:hypothetical protein GO684_03945 [Wolbachia endosymbiont of Litomosoides brasiliensis]|uniref:hypothetical protein n=1 Tax=Wolbachia endosymbiont of Litomosoides brasiliensis TaxID=1812117 RepID=UPI00158BA46D|nr:hypothetical protein [Wolbachia endosymbiont of Litomosoides brasiliensis]NUY39786.1 hypothetical protein [Wolbachia endosymbiont of Litomosoides brasiliensis]